MRIDTNYAYNTQKSYYPVQSVQKGNVSFGMNLGFVQKMSKGALSYYTDMISLKLGLDYKAVSPLLSGVSEKRASFLQELADKYNTKYFYKSADKKEAPENVIDIFKSIKSPHRQHFSIVHIFEGSFKDMKDILLQVKDKKSYEFLKTMQRDVLYSKNSELNIIFDALVSPNKKKFVNNFEDYVDYFKLNASNKNAVAELDELIKTGKYDKEEYRKIYALKMLYESNPKISEIPALSKENLDKYYSKAGIKFFEESLAAMPMDKVSEKSADILLNMYKTSNEYNVNIRNYLFKDFIYNFIGTFDSRSDKFVMNNQAKVEEGLGILNNLFKRVDESSGAKEFLKKCINGGMSNLTIKDYENILSEVPPQKANIFFDNIERFMLARNDKESKMFFLKNKVTSPFYETKEMIAYKKHMKKYGYDTGDSLFGKLSAGIKNIFQRIKYAFSFNDKVLNLEKPTVSSIQVSAPVVEKAVSAAKESTPIVKELIPNVKISAPVQEVPKVIARTEKPQYDTPKLIVEKAFKSKREAARYQVVSDVNDIIKSKLGAKTYEKQAELFEKKATKMRLKLLPEIFQSVKETRAADRAIGRKQGTAANKDVVKLYSMINSNNKKLVNYMLKKRNIDGSRMYNVKDIVELLSKTEKSISKQKSLNPQYRAKDAKLYYDKIHSDMMHSYGTLRAKNAMRISIDATPLKPVAMAG